MSATNRAALITKTHKVLAKHYKPVTPTERPVLEQLLYACCVEDAPYDVADECFARLQESLFDWNEVRVTTVKELAEILKGLPDPQRAATQLKQLLHSVFESIYAFEMDTMKKQNLGAAVKQLESYRGSTPFVVSYVVQTTLGGHSIPISPGAMKAMTVIGVASDREAKTNRIPGLERAIQKTKGLEFGSLLHQLGAAMARNPYAPDLRAILLEINPECKDRLPKRGARKSARAKKKVAPKTTKAKTAKKAAAKKPAATRKKTVKKKPAARKKATTKSISKRAAKGKKKSTSKQLARRKPR